MGTRLLTACLVASLARTTFAAGIRGATSKTGIRGAAIYLVAPPEGDPDGMVFDADAVVSIRCAWKFFEIFASRNA